MQENISPELDRMCCDLIGDMLERYAQNQHLEVTLVVMDKGGEVLSFLFTDDESDQCLEAARDAMRSLVSPQASERVLDVDISPERYALGYVGVVSVDDDGQLSEADQAQLADAIIVEFGEQSMSNAWSCITLVGWDGTEFVYSDPYPGGEVERLL